MTKAKQQVRQDAIEQLRKWIKPGDTLFTVLRSVSRSGMSCTLDVYKLENNEPMYLTRWAGHALDNGFDKSGYHLRVNGCGMDMGFHVVHNLGRTLFPDGFDIVPGTHARNGDTSGRDNDGGYALNHRWI